MSNPWDNWRPKTTHAYCTRCGLVSGGPHTGKEWPSVEEAGERVYAADADRFYFADEAHQKGIEHNVSGSLCGHCSRKTYEEWRANQSGA